MGIESRRLFRAVQPETLNSLDEDLGSDDAVLLPDSAGNAAHPHLMFLGGKEGRVYLIDRDNLGKFDSTVDHVVQEQTGVGKNVLKPRVL